MTQNITKLILLEQKNEACKKFINSEIQDRNQLRKYIKISRFD